MHLYKFFSVLLTVVALSNLAVSTTDNDASVFEPVLSSINDILKDTELSDEERHQKVAGEIKKLSKAIDDIELSKDDVEKLTVPLSQLNVDLKRRIENL